MGLSRSHSEDSEVDKKRTRYHSKHTIRIMKNCEINLSIYPEFETGIDPYTLPYNLIEESEAITGLHVIENQESCMNADNLRDLNEYVIWHSKKAEVLQLGREDKEVVAIPMVKSVQEWIFDNKVVLCDSKKIKDKITLVIATSDGIVRKYTKTIDPKAT